RGPLRAIALSPNGQTLATSGEDGQILVWDPARGTLRRSLAGNTRIVNVLRFLPNGRLFAVDEGSRISDWDAATGRKVRTIKPRRRPGGGNRIGQEARRPALQPSSAAYVSRSPVVGDHTGRTAPRPVGLGSILDAALEWFVPAASAQSLPDPNQGPGGPILVITSASSTFGRYYAEILRNEGLNAFAVADISTVDAGTLGSYDVAILAPVPLTSAQATMFTSWVNAGGNLIAMRPDPQLAGLLGISPTGPTSSNAYLLVDTTQSPGNGIVGQTMQFHGTADRYALNGATSLATLYSDATTPTTNPAVTVRSVGSNGGQAAAFAYDLATSVVYTRQGNPAWAAQERDGITPIRSDDKFFGNSSGDPQPDWVDFSKIAIPQADEQQRLLGNLILEVNLDRKPLPRFWYFPRGEKAVVIMTGDDHGGGASAGTAGRFDQFSAQSPPGCSVANWDCIRGTSYLYADNPLTAAQAAGYNAAGFEVGFHVNTNCADFTPASLASVYSQQLGDWTAKYAGIPAPLTQRHHCVVWSDWVTG
ncbi:MAG: WD40 repeat domain-containing protein, partial [bacterium]